jgi:lipid-binding SYLF domain-containing protein
MPKFNLAFPAIAVLSLLSWTGLAVQAGEITDPEPWGGSDSSASTSTATPANDEASTLALLGRSNGTFKNFMRDPNLAWFQNNVHRAKGLVIFPSFFKGGFIIGGSGGQGVMVARDRINGEWLGPVFYNMGGVSLGLQIGGQASEIVLMIMTDKCLDAMLSTKVQLGASASIAAGPVGKGAEAGLVDVYTFARSKGAFIGVSLDGAVMTTSDKRNAIYYGAPITPIEVFVTKRITPAVKPAVVQSVEYAVE